MLTCQRCQRYISLYYIYMCACVYTQVYKIKSKNTVDTVDIVLFLQQICNRRES